jgi:hypothetical protein
MWQNVRVRLLNLLLITITTSAMLFSLVATWIILNRTAEIALDMSGAMDTVMWSVLAAGVVMFWLNSLLLDSVIWIATRYWTKPIVNELTGDSNEQ